MSTTKGSAEPSAELIITGAEEADAEAEPDGSAAEEEEELLRWFRTLPIMDGISLDDMSPSTEI
jgi:hypothetical protein